MFAQFEGPFTCINVPNEFELLTTWLGHVKETKPLVFVTYNGDFFDWPFIDNRMKKYGLDLESEIGVQKLPSEEYGSRFACHLDAFHWVNRDSYLPQGSRLNTQPFL
jgi:DNA polymerase epsilon subunit 1